MLCWPLWFQVILEVLPRQFQCCSFMGGPDAPLDNGVLLPSRLFQYWVVTVCSQALLATIVPEPLGLFLCWLDLGSPVPTSHWGPRSPGLAITGQPGGGPKALLPTGVPNPTMLTSTGQPREVPRPCWPTGTLGFPGLVSTDLLGILRTSC